MGADLIIAMVLAAGATHAWEQGKRRSAAAWAEARRRAEQRGAARERARQERARARSRRFDHARTAGPRDPLWWAYATGWLVVGSVAAVGAGLAGAYSGAVTGARGGYRAGRESAKKGRSYRETWRQWRTRDWIDTERCARCGGYVSVDDLVAASEFGWVCPDCVPGSAAEQPSASVEDEPTVRAETNGHKRRSRERTREWTAGQSPRCMQCGSPAKDDWVLCVLCARLRYEQRRAQNKPRMRCCQWCAREVEADLLDADGWCRRCAELHEAGAMDDTNEHPHRIHVDAERLDDQEETTKEDPMPELPAAAPVAATGEGYTDTVQSLSSLAKLLAKAHEEVANLGDMLTANSLDAETLGQINELADLLDTAAPMADTLHKHVESRHAPVADAMAGAGGSSNVATKSWYDQY
ncbi:hypothetical protein DFQ14_103105 [Halopolyspora algeriensis]|uniref:Uncharacterized protein n=1 Tax=Halopolyspora algeriensis TaxID=1500506 RepID=A0A368VTJ8_9ACTN|nr:hypothetical protein [Halopolyspora algeriensis]RCW45141.1 hypothetical protein DFQ14_103105 [Halopolyspora algeriensis]TQM53138.1 hypothetical protein FHU43_2519 [Halopolyspora algeriensis]